MGKLEGNRSKKIYLALKLMFSTYFIRSFYKATLRWLMALIDPRKLISWVFLPRYLKHWNQYQVLSGKKLFVNDSYPCLTDWISSTPYDPHYFYQGAWLSRCLSLSRPVFHVDIGSSVLTVGVISSFMPTVFMDYRPLNAKLPNLFNIGGSIVSMPFADASIKSLSCMHVLEHIGLGRYGDPLDPDGPRKAAAELSRVLSKGGRLYLTTPVGRERVCFNAHRVFSPMGLLDMLPGLSLRTFSWVDDSGHFYEGGRPEDAVTNEYACGFYEFEKLHD